MCFEATFLERKFVSILITKFYYYEKANIKIVGIKQKKSI